MNYIEEVKENTKKYYSILSEDFPDFLNDYIYTPWRKVKRRYINPLTTKGRIYDISTQARKDIDDYINMKVSKYAYIDM